jgi:hypothetical protein
MQIFITRGEDSSGPYTPEQVQDCLAQGVLLPDDLAYLEGIEGWIPISELVDSIASSEPTCVGAINQKGRSDGHCAKGICMPDYRGVLFVVD